MKRIHYLDILRVLSFLCVVYFHMMIQLTTDELRFYVDVAPFFENPNMNIVMLAVAIFFILSGASLVYTTRERFDVKRYYKRRITRVWIPLMLVYVMCFIAYCVLNRGLPNVFQAGTPAWRFVFTLLGVDALLQVYGVATFTLGIGEWFIGCLIVYYVLFPALRWLLLKYKWIFVVLVMAVYAGMLIWQPWDIPVHENIVIKGCEFCIGMMLGLVVDRINWKWLFGAVPVLLLFLFSRRVWPIGTGLKITVCALAVFVLFGALERVFVIQKKRCSWL